MIERERGNIKFEIIEHFGVLSTSPTGWTKELNIVRWNDKSEKYDLRDWAPGHDRMSRGITLYEEELKTLANLCFDIFEKENALQDSVATPADAVPETTKVDTVQAADSMQAAVQQPADRVAENVPF